MLTDLFAPAGAPIPQGNTPADFASFPPPLDHCPEQAQAEPMHEYQARCLRYALIYGIAPLTRSQLEHADTAAAWTVAALPQELDTTQAKLDSRLHDLRLRIASRLKAKRAQLAALQALLDANQDDTTQDALDADQGSPEAPQETDADRAARLLKAALMLIMGPQDPGRGGPGSPARLIPPSPTRPPAGNALTPPTPQAPRTGRF